MDTEAALDDMDAKVTAMCVQQVPGDSRPPDEILRRGRLQPGKMFLVDLQEKRIVPDKEIKAKIARRKPYRHWLKDNRIELRGLFTLALGEGGAPEPGPVPKTSRPGQMCRRREGVAQLQPRCVQPM